VTITTDEDNAGTVAPSCSDPDSTSLTYAAGSATHGTTAGGPPLSYTPGAFWNSLGSTDSDSDGFTYTASDGSATSSPANVGVTINGVNDGPTCSDVNLTVDEDSGTTNVAPSCTDPDSASLTYAAGSASSGTSGVDSGDLTYAPNLNFSGGDSFTYTASDGSATSSPATVDVTVTADNSDIDGTVACDGTLATGGTDDARGQNKDGSQDTCPPVDYSFDPPTVEGNFQVTVFQWDVPQAPLATFRYTIPWQEPLPVHDTTNMPDEQVVQVAWRTNPDTTAEKHYGVACTSYDLPEAYSTLAEDLPTGDTTVVVADATNLPSDPNFPIVIGTERMWVTDVSGTTLTVDRGDGGTTETGHFTDDPVMSTPLPIDPNPTLVNGDPNPDQNKVVPMCVAALQWTPAGYDPDTGDQLYTLQTTIIDMGDGVAYVKK